MNVEVMVSKNRANLLEEGWELELDPGILGLEFCHAFVQMAEECGGAARGVGLTVCGFVGLGNLLYYSVEQLGEDGVGVEGVGHLII